MPRWQPKYRNDRPDDELKQSPLEILRKSAFQFLNERLGWRVAAVVVGLCLGCVGWGSLSQQPAIVWVLTRGHELLPLPQAREGRFSIVIPKLENDPEGVHRRLISDALRSQFSKDEVEVLLIDR